MELPRLDTVTLLAKQMELKVRVTLLEHRVKILEEERMLDLTNFNAYKAFADTEFAKLDALATAVDPAQITKAENDAAAAQAAAEAAQTAAQAAQTTAQGAQTSADTVATDLQDFANKFTVPA